MIEALDALIPFPEDARYLATETERSTWHAQDALRSKLKRAVGMSYYDRAKWWLEGELRREREATTERLFSRLAELMRQPDASRRSVREGFATTVREIRDSRQSAPRLDLTR